MVSCKNSRTYRLPDNIVVVVVVIVVIFIFIFIVQSLYTSISCYIRYPNLTVPASVGFVIGEVVGLLLLRQLP